MAGGPMPVGRLVDLTGESQPKVSRHLAYLRNCGIATTQRMGKQVFYGLDLNGDTPSGEMLAAVIGSLTGKRVGENETLRRERPVKPNYGPNVETQIYADADMIWPEIDEPITPDENEQGPRNGEREMDIFLL
jgi:DNA-binding transcriptional ArsR family regulator